jgi:serine/threonine protein kinase
MDLAGYVLRGRYELVRHLADGGMGAVWSAHDRATGQSVAVKLMRVEGAARADMRARFEQEALAARWLDDPHVVRVLDHGTEDDTPFIVMELLDGVDLHAIQAHARAWPSAEIAELLCQVAAGLATAHRAGIVHRDVKPGNIFLVREAGSGQVIAKLIDFGIAKWDEHGQVRTATNVALGSPSYMSPEQIRGQAIDARVDAWSLAVVAFSLVAGELPFVGRNGPEIAKRIVFGQRRPLAPTLPDVDRFEWFFGRAFAPSLDARFGSVEELASAFVYAVGARGPLECAARALDRARSGSPTAEPPPAPEPPRDEPTTRFDRHMHAPPPRAVPPGASTERIDHVPEPSEDDLERTETDDERLR